MPILALSGAVAMTGFRIDVIAAISLLISTAVVLAFARECFGRSRGVLIAAALLIATNGALSSASGPIEFVALWQLQWFVVWSLSLFFAEEDIQAWLGRLLMAGWLFDAVLIAAAVMHTGPGFADGDPETTTLLAWGSALSLATRIAALPVGAHAAWNERSRRRSVAWILMASLPPATVIVLRLIGLLTIDPTSHLGVSQFLVFAALTSALTSLRQEATVRETGWRISAGLAGAAAVSLMLPPWPGRVVWIMATCVCVIFGRRVSDAIVPQRHVAASDDFLGRLEAAAAREWNLPGVWRFGVALPVRGASQVLRFVDGFLFEQIPTLALRKLEAATSPIRRAVPELFSRLLMAVLLAAAFIVLLALAFR